MPAIQQQQPQRQLSRSTLLLLVASTPSAAFLRNSNNEKKDHQQQHRHLLECPRGECPNPSGLCEKSVICAVDPCLEHSCGFDQVCRSNLCGGCHALCAEANDNNDPSHSAYVEPTATANSGGTTASKSSKAAAASPVENVCPYAKWHVSTLPGAAYTCTNSDRFPSAWLYNTIGNLFDSASECCVAQFGADADCIVQDECYNLDSSCPEAKWHMSTLTGGAKTCTNSGLHPEAWTQNGFLFPSAETCCEEFFPEDCIVVEDCPVVTTTTTTTTTTATTTTTPMITTTTTQEPTNPIKHISSCPDKKWHMSTLNNGANICTNDLLYPSIWNTIDGYLLDSAEDCCETFHLGMDNCVIIDHCDCPQNWHKEGEVCTNDDREYPNEEYHAYVFHTVEECCRTNFNTAECDVRDVCNDEGEDDDETLLSTCIDTWHVNPERPSSSCSNGVDNDVTDVWPDIMKGYETGEACCLGYYGEGNPCDIVDKCSNDTATDEEDEEVVPVPVAGIKWWYRLDSSLTGGGECLENDEYPADWITDFSHLLYDTYDECCDNHNDISCLLTQKTEMWYHDNGKCQFGSDYPDWMGAGLNRWTYLFSTKDDCCQVNACHDGKDNKWWPKDNEDGDGFYCEFSSGYPVEFLEHGDTFLYDTEESCCAMFCGDIIVTTTTTTEAATEEVAPVSLAPTSAAPVVSSPASKSGKATTATTETLMPNPTIAPTSNPTSPPSKAPTSTPSTANLTTMPPSKAPIGTSSTVVDPLDSHPFVDITEGFDSFDDVDNSNPIPWIFGSPAEWVRDDTRSLTGPGSLRNILPEGSEASSTLGLKIRIEHYSTISCYAYVETAMPYDKFILEVDGVERYVSYFETNEWINVKTGLQPGDKTIKLIVSKPMYYPPEERTKGSGYVYLDVCQIIKLG